MLVDHKAATIPYAVSYVQNRARDGIIIYTRANHVINETIDDISKKLRQLERNLIVNQPENVAFPSVIVRNGNAEIKRKNTAYKSSHKPDLSAKFLAVH